MNLSMQQLLGQFGGLKSKLEEAQQQAAQKTISVTVGAGMVTVTANGKQEITRIMIDPAVFGIADKGMVEDLIVAGTNQALSQSKGILQEEMQKIVSQLGLPLPPGFDLSKLFG